jgi:hypothetical protein
MEIESTSCAFYTSNIIELLISLFWQLQLINTTIIGRYIKARLEIKTTCGIPGILLDGDFKVTLILT